MSLTMAVASTAQKLPAESQPCVLRMIDESPVALASGGYSTAGDDPGPREFPPDISLPPGGDE